MAGAADRGTAPVAAKGHVRENKNDFATTFSISFALRKRDQMSFRLLVWLVTGKPCLSTFRELIAFTFSNVFENSD